MRLHPARRGRRDQCVHGHGAPDVGHARARRGDEGAALQRIARQLVRPLDLWPVDWHAWPMALQPVNRRSVPEDVFEQIVAEVLSGEMQPGETLPSERRLAAVVGVSRPAVRDFRRYAGLDLLPRLLIRAGDLELSVVRSILETRLQNWPKVAELAARR